MNRYVKSGEGWRLGWQPTAEKFCGLLSGQCWAIELTEAEFSDFCRCVRQLSNTMREMASALMDEEKLTCEQETATIWLEVEGFPSLYSLRFILLSDRKGEGEWPPEAVVEIVAALIEEPFCNLGVGPNS